jgi:hypothetical protein
MRDISMSSIIIRTPIESETLCLPALKAMIGKNVEIIVHETDAPSSANFQSPKDYTPLIEIAGRVSIDPEAYNACSADRGFIFSEFPGGGKSTAVVCG